MTIRGLAVSRISLVLPAAARPKEVAPLELEETQRTLCLIQLAGREVTYLIDPVELWELEALRPRFSSTTTIKLIHYAAFEREVLGRYGFPLEAVVDTRDLSRQKQGTARGHSLREVCARELRRAMDKGEQTGDWASRPLTEKLVTYAALDAEELLRLYPRLVVRA